MRKKKLGLLLALSVLMTGCGPSPDDPIDDVNHYDVRNFITSSTSITETKTRFYDGPTMMESSSKVNVNVEGQDLFVYETRVNHKRKFTYEYSADTNPVVIFDFQGKIHVDIEVKNVSKVTQARISPLVYGITPTISGKHIQFDLEYTDNYVVEYNGDSDNVIHIFTNRYEENPITEETSKNDDSILYIGPGVYEAGAIPLQSNQTIYISGGALVYGQIRAEGVNNVTIQGRGIISGSEFDRRNKDEYTIPIEIRNSENVVIEDLTFLDPAGWCIALYKSNQLTLNNVKIITARANGDGISVQSCSNVQVNGGFVRSWDDSLVVKNVDRGTTSNVIFDGVTVWTDLAQSMEVGYETNGPTMDTVKFQNITVVHNFHKPVISLHNCDDAEISNIYYQNITLEDGQMLGDDQKDGENDFFIDMTIAYNVEWTTSGGKRGSVDGVYIDNVKVYQVAPTVMSRLAGESSDSKIKNVHISNIDYAGKVITNANDLDLVSNEFVDTIHFTHDKARTDILGAYKQLPYRLDLPEDDTATISRVKNIEQEGVLVPEFARFTGELPFIGIQSDIRAYEGVSSHGAGTKATTPGDDGSGVFEESGHSGQLAFDGNENTYYQSGKWKNEEAEFAALTIDFGETLRTIGVIRIKGLKDNIFKYTYSISVYGRKIKNDGTINPTYTRLLSKQNYAMSPIDGNVIDLNISAQEYAGIQLRFYRGEEFTSCESYQISEVEFYPPSLTFGKSIYGATEHNDVYPVTNVVDGEVTGSSYYESKGFPAQFVIDLENIYSLSKIILRLNPSLLWEARTQNIEIQVSSDNRAYDNNLAFTTLFEAQDYVFDPKTGNRITLDIENGVQARYIKVIINSNTAISSKGGQLAEIAAYGI